MGEMRALGAYLRLRWMIRSDLNIPPIMSLVNNMRCQCLCHSNRNLVHIRVWCCDYGRRRIRKKGLSVRVNRPRKGAGVGQLTLLGGNTNDAA